MMISKGSAKSGSAQRRSFLYSSSVFGTDRDALLRGAASILNGAMRGGRVPRDPWAKDLKALRGDHYAVAGDFHKAVRWANGELESQQPKLFEPNQT